MFAGNLVFGLGLVVPITAFIQMPAGTTWDYPLGDKNFTASSADPKIKAYGVDLVNTQQSEIAALKQNGHVAICYFSGGSVEDYRDDAKDFPSEAVGKVMQGWRDEKWVDTRNSGVRNIMMKRIALAQSKGCDGVDVDNVDGYSNDTGFDMTEDDAVDFINAMSQAAHDKGLAYGLKNGGAMVSKVVGNVEWAINEQCAQYNECQAYKPLLDAGKPVFHVEYTDDETATEVSPDLLQKTCAAGGLSGASSIVKHLMLDRWIVTCASTASGTNGTSASNTNANATSSPTTIATQTAANDSGRIAANGLWMVGATMLALIISSSVV